MNVLTKLAKWTKENRLIFKGTLYPMNGRDLSEDIYPETLPKGLVEIFMEEEYMVAEGSISPMHYISKTGLEYEYTAEKRQGVLAHIELDFYQKRN